MPMANAPILIMAGGTGGHIFPALAVAEELAKRHVPVVWLGSAGGMEEGIVRNRNIEFVGLTIKGVRGKNLLSKLSLPVKLVVAIFQAARIIVSVKPQCVLGLGGFASGPGGLAAILLRRPLVIQEQNAIPGMTNKYLAKYSDHVLEGFAGSQFGDAIEATHVGNPVRSSITALEPVATRLANRQGKIRILIFGGSLGAQRLNQVVPQALARIDKQRRPMVRHQTGKRLLAETEEFYHAAKVEADVVDFIDDMAEVYAWADLVIARAGALTVTELMHAGLASILVPYPHAVDDHQAANARILVDCEAALMVRDNDLSAESLANILTELMASRDVLIEMGEAAHGQSRARSAETVVDICLGAVPAVAA